MRRLVGLSRLSSQGRVIAAEARRRAQKNRYRSTSHMRTYVGERTRERRQRQLTPIARHFNTIRVQIMNLLIMAGNWKCFMAGNWKFFFIDQEVYQICRLKNRGGCFKSPMPLGFDRPKVLALRCIELTQYLGRVALHPTEVLVVSYRGIARTLPRYWSDPTEVLIEPY